MNEIRQCVHAVRARQQRQWMWRCVSGGLLAGGVAGCVLGLMRLMEWGGLSWASVTASLLMGPALGWLFSFARKRPEREAAVAIDRTYGLKDRVATALGFLAKARLPAVWRELQIDDARQHVASVEPAEVVPIRAPKSWGWGLGLSALAIGIAMFSPPVEPVAAAVVQSDVVAAQAVALAEGLEELEEFNAESPDPEVEELLKQLARQIEDLKQPGLDPREALAKLSEMEAALQKQQKQLSAPNVDAQLAAIGEALSLSDEMQAAGEAMSQGKLEKAAAELAKLEMP